MNRLPFGSHYQLNINIKQFRSPSVSPALQQEVAEFVLGRLKSDIPTAQGKVHNNGTQLHLVCLDKYDPLAKIVLSDGFHDGQGNIVFPTHRTNPIETPNQAALDAVVNTFSTLG